MKQFYLLLSIFILGSAQGQTIQNDSIYFWKSGVLLEKRSIKEADLDSITFKRPIIIPNVTICSQVWATKNLDVTTYSDGTPIPQVTDQTAWVNLTTGAWCYYNNDPTNNAVYGKLYNWYAAAGIYDAASLANPALRKSLAPTGWHIPTDAEWTTLTTCLGGESVAGDALKEAGTTHWASLNIGATNSSGFTGLPGGGRSDTYFTDFGGTGFWWSSSEYYTFFSTAYAWTRKLSMISSSAFRGNDKKTVGCSVRCVKN